MTPLAVVDRYLDIAGRDPVDGDLFIDLVGTDADLLGRWLLLAGGAAAPDELRAFAAALDAATFRELAINQALGALTGSGNLRLGADTWRQSLTAGFLAEVLAEELVLPDPVAVRWRVLLGLSGVKVPADAQLTELSAFRSAHRSLLEDAAPLLRIFAVADVFDALDPGESQAAAAALLALEPLHFQTLLRSAESRADACVERLALEVDQDVDWSARLWLRLRVGLLGNLFAELSDDAAGRRALAELHGGVSRMLFGQPPLLLLLDGEGRYLVDLDGRGPRVALGSATSAIARSARLGERIEIADRPDQPVADRQLLRLLAVEDAVCLPLKADSAPAVQGVLLFPFDEDVDDELGMHLYAQELGRRLHARTGRARRGVALLQEFRQREEKRLREILHEVNNPLSVVQNYLHILQLRLPGEPKAVEQLGMIGMELRRVTEILERVREVPELGETRSAAAAALADVQIDDLVGRIAEMHRGHAESHDARLITRTGAGTVRVRSDEQRIAQVLSNLVRNAIEADRGHEVRVETVGGLFRDGRECIQIIVADTGPGLPRSVLENFGAPQQTTKGAGHAGLGLHIVHRLVAELKGSIDVRVAPGEGTAFSLFLPLEPR